MIKSQHFLEGRNIYLIRGSWKIIPTSYKYKCSLTITDEVSVNLIYTFDIYYVDNNSINDFPPVLSYYGGIYCAISIIPTPPLPFITQNYAVQGLSIVLFMSFSYLSLSPFNFPPKSSFFNFFPADILSPPHNHIILHYIYHYYYNIQVPQKNFVGEFNIYVQLIVITYFRTWEYSVRIVKTRNLVETV